MSPGDSQARTAVLDPGTWTNDDINDDIKCSAFKKNTGLLHLTSLFPTAFKSKAVAQS